MTNIQNFQHSVIKSTIKYLLQFICVYVLSLFFLAVMFEGLKIPDERVFIVAFYLTFALIASYETSKQHKTQETNGD